MTLEREPKCRRFAGEDEIQALLKKSPKLEEHEMDGPWGKAPAVVVQLVKECFAKDPKKRPKMVEVAARLAECLQDMSNGTPINSSHSTCIS